MSRNLEKNVFSNTYQTVVMLKNILDKNEKCCLNNTLFKY